MMKFEYQRAGSQPPLGTRCIIDTVSHTLSPEQKQALQILGCQVSIRLQLRTQRKAVKKSWRKIKRRVTRCGRHSVNLKQPTSVLQESLPSPDRPFILESAKKRRKPSWTCVFCF